MSIGFILQMLFVIMHEEFALKTAHLIQPTDVRHTDYLTTVPSVSRKKTIRRGITKYILFFFNNHKMIFVQFVLETRLLHQDRYPSMIPESVPSSRISFAM